MGTPPQDLAKSLNAWRKEPRQARSAATVDAILEATVQVILQDGAARLTTTRVAARAGVSIGSMYQYFPNKRALTLALFERHMEAVAAAIESVCERHKAQPLNAIADALVSAFMQVMSCRPGESQAAYIVAIEAESARTRKPRPASRAGSGSSATPGGDRRCDGGIMSCLAGGSLVGA